MTAVPATSLSPELEQPLLAVEAALNKAGVPCSAYRTVAEALADPQIAHRQALRRELPVHFDGTGADVHFGAGVQLQRHAERLGGGLAGVVVRRGADAAATENAPVAGLRQRLDCAHDARGAGAITARHAGEQVVQAGEAQRGLAAFFPRDVVQFIPTRADIAAARVLAPRISTWGLGRVRDSSRNWSIISPV